MSRPRTIRVRATIHLRGAGGHVVGPLSPPFRVDPEDPYVKDCLANGVFVELPPRTGAQRG